MQFKSVSLICLIVLFPVLPFSYIGGSLGAAALHSVRLGYELGAWLTIFILAYLIISAISKIIYSLKKQPQT